MLLFGTCSDKLKLSNSGKNGITIIKNDDEWASVYGREWIQSTDNRSVSWDVALKGNRNYVCFGLVSKQHHGDTERGIFWGHGGYVVTATGYQWVDGQEQSENAHKLNDGETITITLNLSQSRIESKKGKDEKIIFGQIKRDSNIFYRFAVSLYYWDSSLTVTQSEGGFDEEDQKKNVKYKING